MIQLSSSSARRDHSCDRKIRCKKETMESWQQSTRKRSHALVYSFLFFHFPSVVVRSSKIKVFGMAVVGRGYHELERRRVINTLLDAGVESMQEPQEIFWSLMKARIERRAPQNLVHLEQLIHEVWAELTIDDVAPFLGVNH